MKGGARRVGGRRRGLLIGLVLAALVILARAAQLQVVEGERWAQRAEEQQRERLLLPAPRGVIYDRDGVPLAASREAYRVAVAPRELRDPTAAAARLREVLGLTAAEARRAVDGRRRWVVLPGRYDARVREKLDGIRGIYFERVTERYYPHGELALELLGRVSAEGRGVGGLELEFDSLLSGRPGAAVVRRDGRGVPIPGAMLSVAEPVPGHDLYLTIDYDLQEIAEDVLREAVRRSGAAGGELLLVDPRTGEILAAASRRARGQAGWRAATEPYEPGSTLKPFFVAALLAEGRARLDDRVYAEQGVYQHGGRTVRDVHGYGWLTVREALRHSSNIVMVKLSERLDPGTQYRYLRDFGFGTPTGVTYPSESSGVLRRPRAWSRYSQASLAIGYEISVTPLQMAMAYGALANGGVLMEPRLVREVRSRDGEVLRRYPPRAVRRVVSPEVAEALAEALVEVVTEGTGREAALGSFRVAGKTGTARVFQAGEYRSGAYTASFAGFFPADDPQLVFLAKLDEPQGEYYGGVAAAPVIRVMLAGTLAAWNTPLDRQAIAAPPPRPSASGRAVATAEPDMEEGRRSGVGGPFIFALNAGPPRPFQLPAPAERKVPGVVGLSLRDAIRRLHAAGFRVSVSGTGPVRETVPQAGTTLAVGSVVHVTGSGGERGGGRNGRTR